MKQLRLTTTEPRSMFEEKGDILVKPTNIDELIFDDIKAHCAYIHGNAEAIAGFDIPTFIDGNFGQLDLPIEEQDILLLLPSGEYKCKAEYIDDGIDECYYITLFDEGSQK